METKELFEKIAILIRALVRGILVTLSILAFCPTYVAYIFTFSILFLHKLWPRLFWALEGKLYRWLAADCAYWGYTAGYKILEYGDDLTECENERCLVLVNHQSTADVPTMCAALQNKGSVSRKALWVMDKIFRWTPFGIVSQIHGDHFIGQGKAIRDRQLELLHDHLENIFWERDRRWVIVFPEGGFLYKRRVTSQAYAQKHGFPHLEHCTLPRTGAVRVVLETCSPQLRYTGSPKVGTPSDATQHSEGVTQSSSCEASGDNGAEEDDGGCEMKEVDPKNGMGNGTNSTGSEYDSEESWDKVGDGNSKTDIPSQTEKKKKKKGILRSTISAIRSKSYLNETRPPIKYVVDVTLAFQDGDAVGLHHIALGYKKASAIRIHYRVHKTEEVPWHDEELLRNWMYERWEEKEKLLADYYKTGNFAFGEKGREIDFPWYKMVGTNLFYVFSIWAHWQLWVRHVVGFFGTVFGRILG